VLGGSQQQTSSITHRADFSVFRGEDILGKNLATDYFYKFWMSHERPARKHIHPEKMKSYLENLVIMDVQRNDDDIALHVRLIGTLVAHYYGEITDKDVNAMPNEGAAKRIYYLCSLVLDEKAPLLTGTPGFAEDKQYLEAWALYMPLFDEAGAIEKILVCVDIQKLTKPDEQP